MPIGGIVLHPVLLLQGEITDVKISCDSKMAASSSTDTVIRVWSLEAETLGHPVAVLMGCTKMINYLDWHPILPNALASVSADGSCRVWDATTGVDPIVLRPRDDATLLSPAPSTAAAALQAGRIAAQESGAEVSSAASNDGFVLTCCAWSKCGTFLAVGGNHCAAYMWMWPVRTIRTVPGAISVRKLQV
jgi:WD40 repeat protein